MQLQEVKSEGLIRHFRGVIPVDVLTKAKNGRLAEISKNRKIPGFRPGKIPAAVLEKKYGQEAYDYVISQEVEKKAQAALAETRIRPAVRPKLEIISEDDKTGIVFELHVEVYPEITPPDFSAITFSRYIAEVSAQSIDDSLMRIANQQATFEEDTSADIVSEDHVVIADLAFDIPGVKDGHSTQPDVTLELGQRKVLPAIEEKVVGSKVGDVVSIPTVFPSHADAKIANKHVVYQVTIKKLKKRIPHVQNDELAQKVGLKSLAELKKEVETRLQEELDSRALSLTKRELFDALDVSVTFDLPPTLVAHEAQVVRQNVKTDTPEGTLTNDQEKEISEVAGRRIKLGLLFNHISDERGLDIPMEKVQEALMQKVNQNPAHAKQILDYYKNTPGAIDEIRGPLLENAVVEHIISLAKPEEKKITEKDLFAKLEN
ncbi:MAG: trigger factor [Alphaproteobacteria bacterium]|nr:MAG: trigger factor [Alphaproteobacteria bacterium]